MPCSGSFLASNASGAALTLWWDRNSDPYFDRESEFDQHVVHELMFFRPEEFEFAVLDVRQFDLSEPHSFLRHYSGACRSPLKLRHRILTSIQKIPDPANRISSLDITAAINGVRLRQTLRCSVDLMLSRLDARAIACQ